MSDTGKEIWGKIRQKGRSHFLKTKIISGIILGFGVTLLREINISENFVINQYLIIKVISSVLIFTLVFYLFGLWQWKRNEKKYQD